MLTTASICRCLKTAITLTLCFVLPQPVFSAPDKDSEVVAGQIPDVDPPTLDLPKQPAEMNLVVPKTDVADENSPSDVPSVDGATTREALPPPAPFDSSTLAHLNDSDANILESQVLTEAQIQALLAATRPSTNIELPMPAAQSYKTQCANTLPQPPSACQNPEEVLIPQTPKLPIPAATQTVTIRNQVLTNCNSPRFWVEAEVLAMWLQGDNIPTLLTTSPAGTPQADAGRLGLSTTTSLFGGQRQDDESMVGGRIRFGRWLQRADQIALEAEYSDYGQEDNRYVFESAGVPTLARPFFDVNPGVAAEAADLVALDTVVSGRMTIRTDSDLYGGSAGMRIVSKRWSDPCTGRRIDWLSGFRYLHLSESLRIDDQRTAIATHASPYGTLDAGTTFDSFDQFKTENNFYGFDLGVSTQQSQGRWSLLTQAKIALGVNHQASEISGQRTITPLAGAASTQQGGLLSGDGNLGEASRQRFAVVPEAKIVAGLQLTSHLRATLGYQFLYLNDAIRPGGQIDRAANSSLLDAAVADAGPSRPGARFDSESVYLHGGTFGLEFSY